MKPARVLAAGIVVLLATVGCSKILGIEPGQLDDAGTGMPIPSDGGAMPCEVESDCPPPPFPDCRKEACEGQRCVSEDAPAGKPTTSQIAGDCQRIECDGHGLVRSAPADDPRDDGRECTTDTCSGGVPANSAKPAGTPCSQGGGAVCSGAGDCVECLTDANCPGKLCRGSSCVPLGCADGQKDGGETDTDCGGPCSPCNDGLHCVGGADCKSGTCQGQICKSPTCSDAVKNGNETDVDCGGGACAPCLDGRACSAPTDCIGGACQQHVCCTSMPDMVTCIGHCGQVVNNCGQLVNCSGCPGPAACVQGQCVCMPEPMTQTCNGKCGLIPNNCGQPIDCGPCGMSGGP